MDCLSLEARNQVEAFADVKLLVVVSEEAVRLVTPMVLGAETPINIRNNRLILKVLCSEDTAAYLLSLLALMRM